eukprot:scaffold105336_cov66-Phaeocystis_antarctica.AAC.1
MFGGDGCQTSGRFFFRRRREANSHRNRSPTRNTLVHASAFRTVACVLLGDHSDPRGAQAALVEHVAWRGDMHDGARLPGGVGRLEHRVVEVRVEVWDGNEGTKSNQAAD